HQSVGFAAAGLDAAAGLFGNTPAPTREPEPEVLCDPPQPATISAVTASRPSSTLRAPVGRIGMLLTLDSTLASPHPIGTAIQHQIRNTTVKPAMSLPP